MFMEANVILDNAECQCIGLSGLCGSYSGRNRGLRPSAVKVLRLHVFRNFIRLTV